MDVFHERTAFVDLDNSEGFLPRQAKSRASEAGKVANHC